MVVNLNHRTVWLLLLVVCAHNATHTSELMTGDTGAAPGTSFSFPLQANDETINNVFYVAAHPTGGAGISNQFALSYLVPGAPAFVPLTPQTVMLNGVSAPNPLYNKGILFLDVMATAGDRRGLLEHPVAVTADLPANLYLIETITTVDRGSTILSAENLRDANGAITAGIVGIVATTGNPSGVFAGVQASGGNFGDVGSGIAVVQLSEQVPPKDANGAPIQESKDKKKLLFFQLDAQQVTPIPIQRAAPLDISSSVVKIQDNLAFMQNVTALYWDISLQRLFIGLQVQAGAAAGDGAKAIVVASVSSAGVVSFVPFAPNTVFTDTNEIVGALQANAQVSIHQLQTMKTTTLLDYLIVLGGNGDPASTLTSMYALPLVNELSATGTISDDLQNLQGTLAAVSAIPQAQFMGGSPSFIIRRVMTTPATTPADIFTNDLVPANSPALIGGGPLAAGPIDKFLINKDTVFAFVGTPAVNQLPGIFYSQALFDAQGKIKTWTAWQRVAGTINNSFGGSFDAIFGNFTFMTGADETMINTVLRTAWGDGSPTGLAPLTTILATNLPVDNGGIQGLVQLQRNEPGLNEISLLIATGLNRVVLAQTGSVVGATFTPTQGAQFATTQTFDNGTLTADAAAPVMIIGGGVLTQIGPITTAAVAQATSEGYLFVGGFGGVAVLTTPGGNGWDTAIGLGSNLVGLVSGMSFKLVGNYSYVRKLIYDATFLYVVTDTLIDRLDLTTPGFPATTIARITDFAGAFGRSALLDLVVSGPYGLLGTTVGLFGVGSGANIQVATSPEEAQWTAQVIPGNDTQPAQPFQLLALSPTGRPQDVGRGQGGNIYLLNSYQGKSVAALNRFDLNAVDVTPVSATTLQSLPDVMVQNVISPYINFGDFVNRIASDGAFYLSARPQNLSIPVLLKSGKRPFATIPLNLTRGSLLMNVVRNSATGSWLVAGDGGMHVNE